MADPILIGGGGIGGLCAAVALARAGFPVRVLEQMEAFSEAGAGIQLGPNAMRLLEGWGIAELVSAYGAAPDGIWVYEGLTGELLTTVPLGREVLERYGAPSIVVRRAHLQQCLLEAAWSESDLEITTGFRIARFEQSGDGVEIFDESGASIRGAALIGADGLQSTVRAAGHETRPETIAKTAWRSAIPTGDAPAAFGAPYIGIWMAPYSHLVHYPVDAGKEVDVIAIVEETYHFDGWGAAGDPDDLMPHFHDWNESTREFLEQLDGWTKWTLFTMQPLSAWGEGCVTLLGDAAHPIQPFLAQGSAMAIEDAAVLADELRRSPGDVPAALRRYEQSRAKRTSKVQAASDRLGRISHLAGLPRMLRDLVLRRRSPESLLSQYDWLYGYALPADEPVTSVATKGTPRSEPSPS